MDGRSLYDRDYAAWAEEQSRLLRRLREERSNVPLDLENLAEEVADLGNNELDVIEGNLTQAVVHLLKLEWSPDREPRRHWLGETTAFRVNAERKLMRSPGLRARINVAVLYRNAVRIVRKSMGKAFGGDPAVCPWTLDQVMDEEFIPQNRHGLVDED
ncbi:MAG TPA: DUF29 domain-containing protein [Azospirillaceae bacterium]|nr:DUF29 domain-containing protein [Azospirillaceae bacterium]